MADAGMVNNVAAAMSVSLDYNASPEARQTAYSYLESIKSGDVRVLGSTSFSLVQKEWSSEIRLQAFKLLQHLVRLRWDELNPAERRSFANAAVDLMSEIADPREEWALKSQTAALVAEMVRREGLSFWLELFPSLVSMSNQGPSQAAIVSMTLRWLPEDIMIHNEDLEGDRRRLLLRGLTESLPQILPLLFSLLERHFGAAVTEAGKQQMDVAKQHASTVTATLNAVNAYAEWAPLPDLAKYGIIHGCGFLLSSPDFRLHAVEFFKLVSQRKRPTDGISEFDSAMSQIFQILMNISSDFLLKSSSGAAISESEFEFAEYVCESMVTLGSSNLQCIASDSTILPLYLQQMLGYFQHYKLILHCKSLPFWLTLMRDLLSKSKTVVTGEHSTDNISSNSGEGDIEKKMTFSFLNDDHCSAILDMGFRRMLRKEKVHPQSAHLVGSFELWSDDFEDPGGFSNYRSRLMELIRFVASYKPLTAATKICERIITIIKSLLLAQVPAQELPIMDSMQPPLENVVSTVFDESNDFCCTNSDDKLALCRVFEGLLQQLLGLKWTEPSLVQALGRYLDALGPLLKHYPDAAGSVINKLFELLTSLPYVVKDPATSTSRHARLQICTSFIRIAKAGDKSLVPHMKGIADTMAYLQKEGSILRGEYNILAEAFLIMASAAGIQQQQEVLAYFLEPLSKQWTLLDWQNTYLSEPAGFVRLCAETSFMWSLFHTLTFFERALKRSGFRKGTISSQSSSTATSTVNPMASHISWMLPPLLKLLRCVHSLWSPPVAQALPAELKGAMVMSDVEKTSLLGEGSLKLPKTNPTFSDGSQFDSQKEGYSEPVEKDIRNWLKGIRESGYGVLGLSATIEDSIFKCVDLNSIALALVENIQYMEFRHIRLLVHSVLIQLVKSCPSNMWDGLLQKLLHPLLSHAQQTLSCSWSSLLQEGRAKVPDLLGMEGGSDLKIEVMEEKLLRDLTREVCSLLSVMASSSLNPGLPLEQSGHAGRLDVSNRQSLDLFASSSMIGFLLHQKNLALPALQICLEAFRWTDTEAVTKVSTFAGAVVLLAILTSDAQLQEFVCRNLFSAIIESLALESNAIISATLVGLCCEIFTHLSQRDPAPREILLSLPSVAPQDLLAFEEALSKTSSTREQKQHMRSFLSSATGNKLKALATQKSVNVITNVTLRSRNLGAAPESNLGDGDAIGLAAFL
ncbi:OLC1v1000717C1 [Oldenlandia corymbosa var. corymbosa]|uniref:OLC1v1000717C1 n=1 Tax=Oldenlandia corymbosa var. corymbosa TaxID=529605 RepID=A0AAV1D3V9_OLDCO|nr:OLC1v1000717C1 [Oldenlandia corymbosa var. corymbosa]